MMGLRNLPAAVTSSVAAEPAPRPPDPSWLVCSTRDSVQHQQKFSSDGPDGPRSQTRGRGEREIAPRDVLGKPFPFLLDPVQLVERHALHLRPVIDRLVPLAPRPLERFRAPPDSHRLVRRQEAEFVEASLDSKQFLMHGGGDHRGGIGCEREVADEGRRKEFGRERRREVPVEPVGQMQSADLDVELQRGRIGSVIELLCSQGTQETHVDHDPPVFFDVLCLFLLAQKREQGDAGLLMHLLRDLLFDRLCIGGHIDVQIVAEDACKGRGRNEFFCRGE